MLDACVLPPQRPVVLVGQASELERPRGAVRTKADLEILGEALVERFTAELARHTKAIQEALSTQISAIIDEKYADLPARVSRLETTVFAPKRR